MPDVTDQLLVFNMGDSSTINRQNGILLRIVGRSYQSFKMIKEILDNEFTYNNLNLMLRWFCRQYLVHGTLSLCKDIPSKLKYIHNVQ